MLAVITCACLVTMISVVVVLIVSSSDLDYDKNHGEEDYDKNHGEDYDKNHGEEDYDKNHGEEDYDKNHGEDYDTNHGEDYYDNHGEDDCDNNHGEDYYDNGGPKKSEGNNLHNNYRTWTLFQRMAAKRGNMEFGISFSFDVVTPQSLDVSAGSLAFLRILGMRHYGLLNVLTFQNEYSSTISTIRGIIAKLKYIQGSDPGAKTVLAFGPYEYSANFMTTIQAEFTNVVNTFMADIVIAITSTGWLASEVYCKAAPPNSINTDNLGHIVLESHWFAVSSGTIFSKPSVITGLSFELSALKYVMVENPTSLKDSILRPCLSVNKTGREALCKHSDFTGGPENYLGDPIYAYGAFSSASKVLTWSEYNDSLARKEGIDYYTESFLQDTGIRCSPSKSELLLYRPRRRGHKPKDWKPLAESDINLHTKSGDTIPRVASIRLL
ncbi:hypothetical protein MTO96_039569, partial [Rhipicephalus appendiculatus]